jgi:glycosyltransferase involved in cell wall biosynthesis
MHWSVAAPFFTQKAIDGNKARWLDDFVTSSDHTFTKIPCQGSRSSQGWHTRISRNTPASDWQRMWKQSDRAWHDADGSITVFPQLANLVGWRKQFSSVNKPLLAYCFNVGALYPGIKRQLALVGLNNVNKFIVHSRRECETVSHWLGLPQDLFEFVPLQRARIKVTETEQTDEPFVLSMGSANRDYASFFEVMGQLKLRTILVVGQHAIKGLTVPDNVEVRTGLTPTECHQLAQKARVNVVPLIDHHTGAGQITIIEAMRMNKAVVATRCVGSEDYIESGKTGFLVDPYSVEQLAGSIKELWYEDTLRNEIGKNAGIYAENTFSDEKVGDQLASILDSLK